MPIDDLSSIVRKLVRDWYRAANLLDRAPYHSPLKNTVIERSRLSMDLWAKMAFMFTPQDRDSSTFSRQARTSDIEAFLDIHYRTARSVLRRMRMIIGRYPLDRLKGRVEVARSTAKVGGKTVLLLVENNCRHRPVRAFSISDGVTMEAAIEKHIAASSTLFTEDEDCLALLPQLKTDQCSAAKKVVSSFDDTVKAARLRHLTGESRELWLAEYSFRESTRRFSRRHLFTKIMKHLLMPLNIPFDQSVIDRVLKTDYVFDPLGSELMDELEDDEKEIRS